MRGLQSACRGGRHAAAREETGTSADGEARNAQEKKARSAAKEGGLLLGLEVVSELAVDLVGDAISDLFS